MAGDKMSSTTVFDLCSIFITVRFPIVQVVTLQMCHGVRCWCGEAMEVDNLDGSESSGGCCWSYSSGCRLNDQQLFFSISLVDASMGFRLYTFSIIGEPLTFAVGMLRVLFFFPSP